MTGAAPVLAAAAGEGGAVWGVSVVAAAGLLAALPCALLAAARVRVPGPRALEAARRLSLRSFLVGVLAFAAVLLLAAATAASPLFGFPALLALVAASILAFLGLVAEARVLGCELRGRDPAAEGTAAGSVALGWLVLSGLPLLLVAGPLVLLYLVLRATGASIVALGSGEK